MKFSYWLLGILICINLVSVDTSRLNAQNKLDDGLSQKLSLMQDNDTLRILVLLADQVDIIRTYAKRLKVSRFQEKGDTR
jgi:hypothetical protein